MKNEKQGVAAAFVRVLLWIYSICTFGVMMYLFYNSLRTKSDFLSNTYGAPKGITVNNYIKMIVDNDFFRYFFNSIVILTASLVLVILISSMTAYGIARYSFRLKKATRVFFLIGMMFPAQLSVIPLFIVMKNLSLVDNPVSVILISASGISLPVFMLTNFFARLPQEIYEAAVVDGAGEWKVFFRIMFPMASPAVMSICITTSIQIWNQFFIPLIFLQSDQYKTVPLLVTKYTGNLLRNIDMAFTGSVLATIPILIIFTIFSKRIIEGITAGAVKG